MLYLSRTLSHPRDSDFCYVTMHQPIANFGPYQYQYPTFPIRLAFPRPNLKPIQTGPPPTQQQPSLPLPSLHKLQQHLNSTTVCSQCHSRSTMVSKLIGSTIFDTNDEFTKAHPFPFAPSGLQEPLHHPSSAKSQCISDGLIPLNYLLPLPTEPIDTQHQ